MGELIFNALLAIAAIVLFIMTFGFTGSRFDASGGPAMFPRLVIIVLLILLVIRSVQILRSKQERDRKFVFFEMFRGTRLFYMVTTIFYFLLVKRVGFIICTIVYLILTILVFWQKQEGKPLSAKGTAIVCVSVVAGTILLDYVFCNLLHVLLPKGIIGF